MAEEEVMATALKLRETRKRVDDAVSSFDAQFHSLQSNAMLGMRKKLKTLKNWKTDGETTPVCYSAVIRINKDDYVTAGCGSMPLDSLLIVAFSKNIIKNIFRSNMMALPNEKVSSTYVDIKIEKKEDIELLEDKVKEYAVKIDGTGEVTSLNSSPSK
jgi:hypothetical protein